MAGITTALAADWIVPVTSAPISGGYVALSDGHIAEVGAGTPRHAPQVLRFPGSAILPGLVSAHTHLACGFLKGLPDAATFYDWLFDHVSPKVRSIAREDRRIFLDSAQRSVREAIAGGITFVADAFLDPAGRVALDEAGLPGTWFLEFFGISEPDPAAYAKAMLRDFETRYSGEPASRVGLSIHSPYLCPSAVVEAVVAAARAGGRRLSIHLDESREEHEMFTSRSGRLYSEISRRSLDGRFRLDRTPTAVLSELGALTRSTLLAHAVHAQPADLDVIRDSGASVVHCPTSNLRLGTGIAPVGMMLERGINVALGVDSAASNGKLDMFEEMRLAALLSRARHDASPLGAAGALRMATLNGARALGCEATTGSLEPGKRGDLIVVDLSKDRHRPVTDPVLALVYSTTPDDVDETWIGGKRAYARPRESRILR